MPDQFTDDQVVAESCAPSAPRSHTSRGTPDIDWAGFDVVAVRSPWDYSYRRDEFVAWADAAGPNLHNSAELLRWNSDKAYVGDLPGVGSPSSRRPSSPPARIGQATSAR